VLVPLLAAFGFYRMAAETELDLATRSPLPHGAEQRALLLAWQSSLTRGYLALIALAFAMGRLRFAWLDRRSHASGA